MLVSQRLTMGTIGADSNPQAAGGWARPTRPRYAPGAEWRVVDIRHRRTMARSARQVSALSDLPSSFSAMGENWRAAKSVAPLGRASPGRWASEHGSRYPDLVPTHHSEDDKYCSIASSIFT